MICWAYLLLRAARRRSALRQYQHCVLRTRQLHQQHISIGHELLAALLAEHQSELRLHRAGILPLEVAHGSPK